MKYIPANNQDSIVTVCISTCNHKVSIKDAVQSVLDQNVKNIKIIIADDVSANGTQEICLALHERFPDQIEALLHEPNLGGMGNVNSIYPFIKNKYVSWFAGDDKFLSNKLSKTS